MRNILQYLSNIRNSGNVRNKIYNFQIKLEKFTDQTKKAEKYQLVRIALSINDNAKNV